MFFPPLIVEIDAEITETAVRLGQYIDRQDRDRFVHSVFSLLLCCIAYEDVSYSTDGMESLLSTVTSLDEPNNTQLWGEYLELQYLFFRKHKDDVDLGFDLAKRIDHLDSNPPVEDAFDVQWSRTGNYLSIQLGLDL